MPVGSYMYANRFSNNILDVGFEYRLGTSSVSSEIQHHSQKIMKFALFFSYHYFPKKVEKT